MNNYDLTKINNSSELLPLYIDIHKELIEEDFVSINEFLKGIQLEKITILSMIGILRITYSWRETIPYWSILLENTINELKNRYEDYKSLLIGLIK